MFKHSTQSVGAQAAKSALVIVVIMLVLSAPIAAQSGGPTVSADGDTTEPGGEATVEITIENGQTIAVSGVPASWSVASHEDSSGTFNDQIDDEGTVGWVWLSGDQDSKSVSVTFDIPSDATTTTVDVVAEDSDGNTAKTGATITIEEQNQPPEAEFDVDPETAEVDQSVTFDAAGASDSDGEITEYRWDFDGDGTVDRTTATETVTHAYSESGTYNPELIVVDNHDATDSSETTVTVESTDSSGFITGDIVNTEGELIDSIVRYSIINSTTEETVVSGDTNTGSYTARVPSGSYEIIFSATEYTQSSVFTNVRAGETVTADVTLQSDDEAENEDPEVNFEIDPAIAQVDQSVSFNGVDTSDPDGSVTEYRWDFNGDGTINRTTTTETVTHAYSEAGTYNPELIVVDDDGATNSSTATVTVEEQNQSLDVSIDADTAEPGGEATVELTIEDGQTISVSEIPSNWSVSSHEDSDGIFNDQIDSGEVGWIWLSGDQDSKSVSVTFDIPSDATTTTIDVVAEDSDGNTAETGGTVTVESLDSTGFISGRVVNEQDSSVPNASIMIEDASGSAVEDTTTNEAGEYSVELSPGEYTVVAESDGLGGEQTVFVEEGVTSTANIVIQSTKSDDGPPTERQLSSTQVTPGGEITVTVQTEAQGDRVAIGEEFSPTVAEASIESVTVNGNSVIPVISTAGSTGATVAVDGLDAGDSVATEYSIEISEDIEGGTNYSITGSASSSGGETPIETDEFTVQEVSPIERQLSSTQIVPGGEITVTIQTEARGDRVAIAEEFSPTVTEASIESVTVNGNSVIPVASAADSTGATVAVNGLDSGDSVATEYSIEISEDVEIGTNYSITGSVSSSGGETPIETDEFTVEEVSPLDGAAGKYDADTDGDITASELGSAVTDFGQGEVTASELGEVVTAFGQS